MQVKGISWENRIELRELSGDHCSGGSQQILTNKRVKRVRIKAAVSRLISRRLGIEVFSFCPYSDKPFSTCTAFAPLARNNHERRTSVVSVAAGNLALGKQTYQSGEWSGFDPSRYVAALLGLIMLNVDGTKFRNVRQGFGEIWEPFWKFKSPTFKLMQVFTKSRQCFVSFSDNWCS